MASSSLSQESLDHDDFDLLNRRSRVKAGGRNRATQVYCKHESVETTDDKDVDDEDYFVKSGSMSQMEDVQTMTSSTDHVVSFSPGSVLFAYDHESPTRAKMKDKRSGWPGHLHKAKPPVKDKRKLREKRRSSGLVHVQSTESTGDSLDETDNRDAGGGGAGIGGSASGGGMSSATHRCTTYNEVIDADNPQTPEDDRKVFTSRTVRNKSPSDLDADFEDNQDYDSTVSQSETNCSRTTSTTKLQTLPTLPSGLNESFGTSSSEFKDGDGMMSSAAVGSAAAAAANESETVVEKINEAVGSNDSTLEEMLMIEQEKNKHLQQLLDQKEELITALEKRIQLLSQSSVTK